MIPLTALLIPVIIILTKHQRDMAEIIHGGRNNVNSEEVAQLRAEVGELRSLINQQSIAIDNLISIQEKAASASISERLEVRG